MFDEPLLAVVTRWGLFTALVIVIGATAFPLLVLGRLLAVPKDVAVHGQLFDGFEQRAAQWGLVGAMLVLPLAMARLGLQVAELRDPTDPWMVPASMMLFETTWGIGWWIQVGAALLAAVGFALARMRHGQPKPLVWGMVAIGVTALAVTPALSGHAVGSPRLTALAVVADTVHVLGAGAWLGTLAITVAAVIGPRQAPPAVVAAVVRSFSPVALVAAALVVTSGVLASWLHVDALQSLWTTPYGRRLLAKLVLFAIVVALGAVNWRRVTPRLDSESGVALLRRSARAELAVAVLMLLVTAILVATPLPGE